MFNENDSCRCAVCVALAAIEDNCRREVSRTMLKCYEETGGDPKKLNEPRMKQEVLDGKKALFEHAKAELRAIPIEVLYEKIATQVVNNIGHQVCVEAMTLRMTVGYKAVLNCLRAAAAETSQQAGAQ